MSKKEMGIAVRALAQYASDCSGNGEYLEMKRAFDIALNIANMYELREAEWICATGCTYINEAFEELEHEIEEGKKAQKIYDRLRR